MLQRLKGTFDILPGEIEKWQYVEKVAKELFENYGYSEIRTPVIESSDLFIRGVGDTSDIVQKEMYIFKDKGDRSVALRPEGTAGVIRAYIENGLASKPSPQKFYYMIPVYRYENVQRGRQREFNQIGTELIGSASYEADAELIKMLDDFAKKLGITEYDIELNSIGCEKCREEYRNALKNYIYPNLDKYCDDCKSRFEKNPMRILDCKVEADKKMNENAPRITDYLCDECKEHFSKVQNLLNKLGVKYTVNPKIVRGLDYYTRTVFEFVSKVDGLTFFGGGRYDGLVEELGGEPTPAVGFGAGFERLLNLMKDTNVSFPDERKLKLFIASIGEEANDYAAKLVAELRTNGVYAEKDIMERSLKAQFKYADKKNAEYVVTIGDEEIKSGEATLKNMTSGEQRKVKLENLSKEI